ncbi:MAG: exodeoxyribonuclease VII small subunit [Myxococcota bacterium]
MSEETPEPAFEDVLARLESIAEKLESGEPKLEDALRLYEEGVRLYRSGTQRLDDAEARLAKLLENGSTESLDPS